MSDPFFSVILPSYNRAAMLRTAVKSVLRQQFADFELLVLDDGSTDGTPQVAREFSNDSRVVWTRFEKNRGQHACRNDALRKARGRFVSFIDSDDLYLPERLESFKRAIDKSPNIGFWFSNSYLYRYGRVIGTLFDPYRSIPQGKLPGYYAVGDKFLPYVTTNLVIKKDAFQKVGFFREDLKILEDTELYARMLASGIEVGTIRECLAVRSLHEGQITREYARDFAESLIALESGGAPKDYKESFRAGLAREIGGYYLKDLQPQRAREFLKEAGQTATWIYLATYTPLALLRTFKSLRRGWLSSGQGPKKTEYAKVEAVIGEISGAG